MRVFFRVLELLPKPSSPVADAIWITVVIVLAIAILS